MSEIQEGDNVEVMIDVEVLDVFEDGDYWVEADGVELMVSEHEVIE